MADPREESELPDTPHLRPIEGVPSPTLLSVQECLRAYGTMCLGYKHAIEVALPAMGTRIDEVGGLAMTAARNSAEALSAIKRVESRLSGAERVVDEVRKEQQSGHDFAAAADGLQEVGERVADALDAFKERAQVGTGPHPALTEDRLLYLQVKQRLEASDAELAAARAVIEAQRKADADKVAQKKRERREVVLSIIKQSLGAIVTAIVLGSAAAGWAYVKGHAQGIADARVAPPAASAPQGSR